MSPRRLRNFTLLVSLLLSGLMLLVWTGQWYSLTLVESATGHSQLSVAGDVAAPALIALALASIALVAALSIAGPFFRAVLAVMQVLLGFTVTISAVLAEANPVRASESAVSAVTGVGGSASVAALVTGVSQTAYPVIAIITGVLTVALGIFVLVTGRRWPGSTGRYRTPVLRLQGENAEGSEFLIGTHSPNGFDSPNDTDSAGISPHGADAVDSETTPSSNSSNSADAAAAAVSDWDTLSGGTDPTSR